MAAKKKATRKTGRKSPAIGKGAASTGTPAVNLESGPPQTSGSFGIETTGRMIVTFLDPSKAGVKGALAAMKNQAGVSRVSHARDFGAAFSMAEAETSDALVFDELGIAVMTGTPGPAERHGIVRTFRLRQRDRRAGVHELCLPRRPRRRSRGEARVG